MEGPQETEELSSGKSSRDQISEGLQQALEEWAMGSLKNLALEVQERLTEELLSWKPAPEKSAEDNLTEIRETVRRYSETLASRGGVLQLTRPLEVALLEALSRWLEQMAAQLLRLLGPAGSPDGVEQLLNRLFRQITGTSPARGRTAARAAAVLREAAGRQPLQGKLPLTEEGVLYRRGEGGARLDRGYSGQALRIQTQDSRPLEVASFRPVEHSPERGRAERGGRMSREPVEKAPERTVGVASFRASAPSPEAAMIRELQFAENFAKSVARQPVLPSDKELPYVSEERLGLELGLLWLKGETAAREPGLTPQTSTMIRQATEQRTENFLYEAGHAFQLAARAYPPGLCPNLWREDVLRVRDDLIRRYRIRKDPQRSLMEAIVYTVELFRGKQGKEKYHTWLRYLPGRGLFLEQPGWEDIRQGWQSLCRSWESFLQDMGIRHTLAFREAVGLQSLWAMVLPLRGQAEEGSVSLWTLTGWTAAAISAAAVTCAIWPSASALTRVAAMISAGLFAGAAVLLLRKSKRR